MERSVKNKVKGFRTKDGAGVSLIRVLGGNTVSDFDPILMLDSFDSVNPDEYTAGFPEHPHRGIETISYLYKGKMIHKDNLGNEEAIGDGEIQWMNAGSGILHEEMIPASQRLLGVQLWLNLPKDRKMSRPTYKSIKNNEIEEIKFNGGYLRLLAGRYENHQGYKGEHLPLDYYDIHLEGNSEFNIVTENDASITLFTLSNGVFVNGEYVEEKTAVKLTEGDSLKLRSDESCQVLFIKSITLKEPIAWAGPIVMNTEEEIQKAFNDLRNGSFIKEKAEY